MKRRRVGRCENLKRERESVIKYGCCVELYVWMPCKVSHI